jgi:hypothetical protein
MLKYKGYIISDSSVPMYMHGCQPRGSVFKAGRTVSVIELQRIEGTIVKTKEEADAHGLELARAWMDLRSAWRSSRASLSLDRRGS